MIEYSIICMVSSALLVASPFVAIEVISACAVKSEKRRKKKEIVARQKQEALARKEHERILKYIKCKWDDKAECRQNRGCDYCAMINCLREDV